MNKEQALVALQSALKTYSSETPELHKQALDNLGRTMRVYLEDLKMQGAKVSEAMSPEDFEEIKEAIILRVNDIYEKATHPRVRKRAGDLLERLTNG